MALLIGCVQSIRGVCCLACWVVVSGMCWVSGGSCGSRSSVACSCVGACVGLAMFDDFELRRKSQHAGPHGQDQRRNSDGCSHRGDLRAACQPSQRQDRLKLDTAELHVMHAFVVPWSGRLRHHCRASFQERDADDLRARADGLRTGDHPDRFEATEASLRFAESRATVVEQRANAVTSEPIDWVGAPPSHNTVHAVPHAGFPVD